MSITNQSCILTIYTEKLRYKINAVLMLRYILLSGIFALSISLGSCATSQCKKMQKTNNKLIAGKHDFGKKTGKWKRKQRY